jgi:hypothetical protein
MMEGACGVFKEVRTLEEEEEDDFPEVKRGGLERLIRVQIEEESMGSWACYD